MIKNCENAAVENYIADHQMIKIISILIQISESDKLDLSLTRRLSYELVKFNPSSAFGGDDRFLQIDSVLKLLAMKYLKELRSLLQLLLQAEEAFKVLEAANEPFKKTRRRLPPLAENELSEWLLANSKHPYMSEAEIESFCDKYGNQIEVDQVRIFLTNARRKMSEGVRKRTRSQ